MQQQLPSNMRGFNENVSRDNADRLGKAAEAYRRNEPSDDSLSPSTRGQEGGAKSNQHPTAAANQQTEDEKRSLGKWTDKNVKSARQQQQGKQQAQKRLNTVVPEEERRDIGASIWAFAKRGNSKQKDKQLEEDRGWDLKFQKLVDYVINAENDMTRNFKLSQRMFDHVGKFRGKAKDEVVKIVEELDKPIRRTAG